MLRILDQLPRGLLELDCRHLADALGGPALIRVAGRRRPPLFVALLLHGNETTGWQAMRRVLTAYQGRDLPRELTLFIGNVHAAREGQRRLDGQADFNRIWRGAAGDEGRMASHVLAEVRARAPLACIDLHNTSGENPVYSCVHRLDDDHIALARRFSDTLVHVVHPDSLLSAALSDSIPSVTIECGKPGRADVERTIAGLLEELLEARSPFEPRPGHDRYELLRSVATVRVPESTSFSFDDDDADLRFARGLDAHNFRRLPGGWPIASLRPGSEASLDVVDENGRDVTERYFRRRNGELVTAKSVLPSLLTVNERIIRQDCLCYLMEVVD